MPPPGARCFRRRITAPSGIGMAARSRRSPDPRLSDIAAEAARHVSVSDTIVAGILGTAIVAVTLSWFALLGYVGWKIAETL